MEPPLKWNKIILAAKIISVQQWFHVKNKTIKIFKITVILFW